MQLAVDMLPSDSAVKTKSAVLAGTELEVVGCLTMAGSFMDDAFRAEMYTNKARAGGWFLSSACQGVLGFTGPAGGGQAMNDEARETWKRKTLMQLTMAMREADHQWVLMRLLMIADHMRLLCHLRGEENMSRLWAVHRDWVLLSYLQPTMTQPPMVSESALAAIGLPYLEQHRIFASRTPPIAKWFATHPDTLASLPTPSSTGVTSSGSAVPPAPPTGGRLFEDADMERRVALACGASMLLTYLVRPPTAPPDRWRRSEFVASHWSLMEKFVRNYPRPSEDRVAVLSDFFANFDAASMADSCCALNFLTSCFLDYHLRQGYGFLFWTGRNSIT